MTGHLMFKLNKAFTPLKITRCPLWKFILDFTERPVWVCAVLRRRFPVGESPTRQLLLQPEAIGAFMEVTKWMKPPM